MTNIRLMMMHDMVMHVMMVCFFVVAPTTDCCNAGALRLDRGGCRRLAQGRLSSTARLKHFCCIREFIRCPHQELAVHVAMVFHPRDVVAGYPERLVACYLAAAPLVLVI